MLHGRNQLRTAALLLAGLLSVATIARAQDFRFLRLSGGNATTPARVELRDGSALGGVELRIDTRETLDSGEGGSSISFRATPDSLTLDRVLALVFVEPRREWLASSPDAARARPLGSLGAVTPPPPDWAEPEGGGTAWRDAIPVHPGADAPWLPASLPIWADDPGTGPGEVVVRQNFAPAAVSEIGAATLRVAIHDARALEARFAGVELNLASTADSSPGAGLHGGSAAILEFDVVSALREGTNVFAIRLRSNGPRPGVAFHLELERVPGTRIDRAPARAGRFAFEGGEVVRGDLISLGSDRARIETDHGAYDVARSLLLEATLPFGAAVGAKPSRLVAPGPLQRAGEGIASAARGIARRMGGAREIALPPGPSGIAPFFATPDIPRPSVALSGERFVAGALFGDAGDFAFLPVARDGSRAEPVPIPDAEGIAHYAARDERIRATRLRGDAARLDVALATVGGERLRGVLRHLSARGAVLENRGTGFFKVPLDHVARIDFVRIDEEADSGGADGAGRAEADGTGASAPRIGIMTRAEGGEPGDDERAAALSAVVQAAAFLAGVERELVPADVLADPLLLTPDRYAALVVPDPSGESIDSVREEGDARHAIEAYVRRGGVLILAAHGAPLRTAVVNAGGRYVRGARSEGLGALLQLAPLEPGGESRGGAMGYERLPDRTTAPRLVAPIGSAPWGSLAVEWEVRPALRAPFVPVLDAAPGARPVGGAVLLLEAADGAPMGPAISVLTRDAGRVVVIDAVAWGARVGGRAFGESELPRILHWAAGRSR